MQQCNFRKEQNGNLGLYKSGSSPVITFMVGFLFDIKLLLFHLAFFQSMAESVYFNVMV